MGVYGGDGSRELVGVSHLATGNHTVHGRELSGGSCGGMSEPMLTVIDGCPGLSKAVDERVFPESDKQRCTKHKTGTMLDKALGLEIGASVERVSAEGILRTQPVSIQKEAVEMFRKVEHEISFSGPVSHRRYRNCLTYYKYPC